MAPKLEGYQFVETVARGATAKVKKCIHVATGQLVAIKILSFKGFPKLNHGALDKFKKRVEREIFMTKHLKHANVLTCYEGHMCKKYAYIVMEWMEGGSLLDYLEERGGTLTEWEARRYFRQLIHGISYCHKLLLVHRDVKPGNLLLDKTKQNLKLIDFGVSNFLNDDLKLSTYCGTNFYLAPEISKGGTLYDGSEVDIYSCGVTLYHLLFGIPSSENYFRGQFCIPNTVRATCDVSDLILRMTAYEPRKRITIPEIKRHRWFLDGDQEFLNDPHFDQCIDNDILLETVNTTKCDREELIQSLIQGQYTEETTTYKLLKKKMCVEG